MAKRYSKRQEISESINNHDMYDMSCVCLSQCIVDTTGITWVDRVDRVDGVDPLQLEQPLVLSCCRWVPPCGCKDAADNA